MNWGPFTSKEFLRLESKAARAAAKIDQAQSERIVKTRIDAQTKGARERWAVSRDRDADWDLW